MTTTAQLVSTAQLAAALGVTPQAIRSRIKAGTLMPHAQVGRGYVFTAEQVAELTEEHAE